MALNPHLADAAANAAANAIAPLANSGKLRIYDGVQPANANAAIGGVNLLAELTMNAAAFGSAAADRKRLLGFRSEWRLWLLRWWRLPQAAYAKQGCGGGGGGGFYPYVVFNCVGTQAPEPSFKV